MQRPEGEAQAVPRSSARSNLIFAGFSLRTSTNDVVVDEVLRSSGAYAGGLRPGDIFAAVDGQPVGSTGIVADALRLASAIEVRRAGRRRMVRVKCVNLAGRGVPTFFRLLRPGAVADRKCDDDCNCTIVLKSAICETWYVPKGKGPNGGIKLEKHCTYSAVTPDGPQGEAKTCTTKEYF
jgi:PDZ domain-containing protein